MSKRKPICKLGHHHDKRMRGGKRVQCTTCGDVMPCRHLCNHIDCRLVRGDALPDWVIVKPEDVAQLISDALGGVR